MRLNPPIVRRVDVCPVDVENVEKLSKVKAYRLMMIISNPSRNVDLHDVRYNCTIQLV